MEITIEKILLLVLFTSFIAEYIDATIGMGYGTTLTPLLLLMGFSPLQIVPGILLSQFVAGLLAASLHHRAKNVFFDFHHDPKHRLIKRFKWGYMPSSKASKVAIVLVASSAIGVVPAALIALTIPVLYLKIYIGILVTAMGLLIIAKHRAQKRFSWKRILGIGFIASFNKGVSGGGYGPLIVSGQILSGVDAKNSIGITALSESVTCLIGVITYLIVGSSVDWMLAPYLVIGSLISVPISVYTVKRIPSREFTLAIGGATTTLGIASLLKLRR